MYIFPQSFLVYHVTVFLLCFDFSGCEEKAVLKKSTMAVSAETTKEGEEVIVRGQGWYM